MHVDHPDELQGDQREAALMKDNAISLSFTSSSLANSKP
jgi:hypothetical protein